MGSLDLVKIQQTPFDPSCFAIEDHSALLDGCQIVGQPQRIPPLAIANDILWAGLLGRPDGKMMEVGSSLVKLFAPSSCWAFAAAKIRPASLINVFSRSMPLAMFASFIAKILIENFHWNSPGFATWKLEYKFPHSLTANHLLGAQCLYHRSKDWGCW